MRITVLKDKKKKIIRKIVEKIKEDGILEFLLAKKKDV